MSAGKVLARPDDYPRLGMMREAVILSVALKEYFSPRQAWGGNGVGG